MIRYALACEDGHRFESWFADSAGYDTQVARGLVSCPRCDSRQVVKAIMAPAIVARRGGASSTLAEAGASGPEAQAPKDVAVLDDPKRQLLRDLRDKVLAETRDVGPAFAREARRIKADDSGERIRGQATLDEARGLLEDGVMVLPMPTLPDDLN